MSSESVSENEIDEPSFNNLKSLNEEHSDLLKRYRDHEADPEFVSDLREYLHRAQAFGVQLDSDNERFELQDILNYWSNVLYRLNSPIDDLELAEYVESEAPDLQMDCPYDHVADFMATEMRKTGLHQRLLADSLEKLSTHRMLILFGPTGSGRSAFVNHILMPTLKAGDSLPGSQQWQYYDAISPGENPLRRLAGAVQGDAASDPEFLSLTVNRLLSSGTALTEMLANEAQPSLIFIDDFEQLFTQCTDRDQRQAFADNLFGLIRESSRGDRVIIVMKQSYINRLGTLGAFAGPAGGLESARDTEVAMTFTSEELRRAILGPAELVGLKFDDGLVERLVLDIQSEPGAIALLQFTMRRLWDEKVRNRITWESYKKVGAGSIALERAANDFYQRMRENGLESTGRYLASKFVRPLGSRDFTTPKVSRAQLYDDAEDRTSVDGVLDQLVAEGLVRRSEGAEQTDDRFSLVHAALVDHWPLLIDWLEEERSKQRQRDRLTSDAQHWDDRDRPREMLWKGSRLQEASEYNGLSPTEKVFLNASQAEEDAKTRRLWYVIGALAGLLVIASFSAYFATIKSVEAARAREIAKAEESLSQARENLREGLHAFSDGDLFRSLPWLSQSRFEDREAAMHRTAAEGISSDAISNPSGLDRAMAITDQVHRIRIGSVLDQAPRLALSLFDSENRPINYVDVSPDGKFAVTVSEFDLRSAVELWDLASGKRLHDTPLIADDESVNQALFSPDGTRIVTACANHKTHVWNVESGGLVVSLSLDGPVTRATFSPEGKRILTINDTDEDVVEATFAARVWDIPREGTRLQIKKHSFSLEGHRAPILYAEFNADADGTKIITASLDNTARIWDANNGKIDDRLLRVIAEPDVVNWAGISPDGKTAVTACANGNAKLWSIDVNQDRATATTGITKPVATWRHEDAVRTAVFSPDGRMVVTSSEDATARIWSVPVDNATLVIPPSILRHGSRVTYACFSPDSQHVLTTSRDRTARVWDAKTGQPIGPRLRHRGGVAFGVFGPHGARVFTCSGRVKIENAAGGAKQVPDGGQLRVWLLNRRSPGFPTFTHRGQVTAVTMLTTARTSSASQAAKRPNRKPRRLLAVASSDRTTGYVQIWDADTGKALTDQIRHAEPVNAIAFRQDGQRIITASDDGEARIWDVSSGRRILFQRTPKDAKANKGTTPIRIAHFADQEQQESVGETDHALTWVGYSPDGKYILTCGRDHVAQLWDAESGIPIGDALKHDEPVLSADFSPDQKHFATASSDDQARIWQITSGGKPVLKTVLALHTADVESVRFSSTGDYLATASIDQTARVWDLDGNVITLPITHDQAVLAATFSPNDRMLATVSKDRFLRIWDLTRELSTTVSPGRRGSATPALAMPTLVAPPLQHRSDVVALSFEPEAKAVRTACDGKVVQINHWSLADDLPSLAGKLDPGLQMKRAVWEVITGHSFTAPNRSYATESATEKLSADKLAEAWETLSRSPDYSSVFGQNPDILQRSIRSWHIQQANLNDLLGRTEPLIWHLNWLLEDSLNEATTSELARLYARRGRAYASRRVRKYELARQDYEQAIALEPENQALLLDRANFYWAIGDRQAALGDCTKVIRLATEFGKQSFGNWKAWHLRARLRGESDKVDQTSTWELIRDDLEMAIERGSDNQYTWLYLAITYLMLEREDDYRSTCARMSDAFSKSKSAPAINLSTWASCLGPGAVNNVEAISAIARDWESYDHWYYLQSLAAATYRLAEASSSPKNRDDFREAQRLFRKTAEARKAYYDAQGKKTVAYPTDYLFEALIHHHLDEDDKALQKLQQAKATVKRRPPSNWSDRAEFEILQSETEAMIAPVAAGD